MVWLLEFIFRSGWTFFGTILLIIFAIIIPIAMILNAFKPSAGIKKEKAPVNTTGPFTH